MSKTFLQEERKKFQAPPGYEPAYVTMQLLTSYTWTTQRSIELLLGAQRG